MKFLPEILIFQEPLIVETQKLHQWIWHCPNPKYTPLKPFWSFFPVKTLVKKLAAIDLEIMDLVKRQQQITNLQSKLIKEQKDIDIKLDKKIATKCSLEKTNFAM